MSAANTKKMQTTRQRSTAFRLEEMGACSLKQEYFQQVIHICNNVFVRSTYNSGYMSLVCLFVFIYLYFTVNTSASCRFKLIINCLLRISRIFKQIYHIMQNVELRIYRLENIYKRAPLIILHLSKLLLIFMNAHMRCCNGSNVACGGGGSHGRYDPSPGPSGHCHCHCWCSRYILTVCKG